tara:strand:- start:35716 stop:36021 length:306 start_codon:yes stop_codon:yes gene_type:complete
MDRDVLENVYQLTVLNKTLGSSPGFVWTVGKVYYIRKIPFKCSRILHDDTAFHFNGQSRWIVCMQPVEDKNGKFVSYGEEFKHVYYENASLEIKNGIPKNL